MLKELSMILIIIGCVVLSCRKDDTVYADEQLYFYVLIDSINSEASIETIQYINEKLPRWKYTITHQSENKWPFYQAFDLDEKVPRHKLVIPHVSIHKYFPVAKFDPLNSYPENIIKFHITIKQEPEGLYNISHDVYHWNGQSWEYKYHTGTHDVDSRFYKEKAEFNQRMLETAVRYSFK